MKLELTHDDVPPDALKAALVEAAKDALEGLQLYDAPTAAALLGLPVQAFRRLVKRHRGGCYDFGQRAARWSGRQIRELQQAHEVKGGAA